MLTRSPCSSSTTSSSDTPTRATSSETSAMVKSRAWLPTTSPDSTCFSVITPATGAVTVA
jgi:hypothetical protein